MTRLSLMIVKTTFKIEMKINHTTLSTNENSKFEIN